MSLKSFQHDVIIRIVIYCRCMSTNNVNVNKMHPVPKANSNEQ